MADSDTASTLKVVAGFVAWIVFLLALSVVSFLNDGDALAKDRAITSGAVERAPARMDVHDIKSLKQKRRTGRELRAFFSGPQLSDLDIIDTGRRRSAFDTRGGNDVLKKWDDAEVTVLVWKHRVIAFEAPDGTLVKRNDVGWWALVTRWSLGTAALGLALISIGIAVTARKVLVPLGLALFVPGAIAFCHSVSLVLGIAIDVVLVAVLLIGAFVVVSGRTRTRSLG